MINSEWVDLIELANILELNAETLRRKCVSNEFVSRFHKNGRFKVYEIRLNSLPPEYLNVIENKTVKKEQDLQLINNNSETYANAPAWSRKQADKYLEVFTLTEGMDYRQVKAFLQEWNKNNSEKRVSYSSYYKAKIKYGKCGINGLLSHRGQGSSAALIADDYLEYYKSLYLREGGPSSFFCWTATLGYAKEKENIDVTTFPSYKTFERRLKSLVPEQAIYMARRGASAWNRKYASYIPRDYSNLKAGSCWVSDHAQIDVAVDFNGTVCFPWVTVFRDVKTSKWLGWFLHPEAPNSDHIFQAFYYGVCSFGIPEDIYLDNGKDYRCKDFAGGRDQSIKVKHFAQRENSLMKNIGVNVHFALPYNAQTKPVERDFLKIKTFLSKGFVGYRGGKITERPEKLKEEIKNNKIMQFDAFKTLFDDFIENFLNKKSSNGKALQGKCPDELWAEEFAVKKVIAKDSLKLFCMRTSKNVSIGRNGIYDSQLELTYWDEWMICEKGRKVFMRRDINAYQEAWVFDAKTEEYLGKANVYHAVSFLAKTNIEKAEYKKAIERKNKEKKMIRSYIKAKYSPSNEDIVQNLKNSLSGEVFVSNPKITEISNTKFDEIALAEKKSNKKENISNQNTALQEELPKIYLTESEKRRDLARRAAM